MGDALSYYLPAEPVSPSCPPWSVAAVAVGIWVSCIKGSAPSPDCVGVFCTASNSVTPAGCRTAQHNADTGYLEIASDPTGLGLSHKTASLPTSDANCQSGLSPGANDRQAIDWRFQRPPFCVQLIRESSSQNPETSYLLDHWFITKGYDSETARWKRSTGQSLPSSPGGSLSPKLPVFTNPET